jgi:hypothetical protein
MLFPEHIRKKVKELSGYQCCVCRKALVLEVHHIIPEKDGGSDDIDNAAPLCPNCHGDYGNDPQRRKGIREIRDWWYERIQKMYPDHPDDNLKRTDQLLSKQDELNKNMSELKQILREQIKVMESAVINIDPLSARSGASAVFTASSELQWLLKGPKKL